MARRIIVRAFRQSNDRHCGRKECALQHLTNLPSAFCLSVCCCCTTTTSLGVYRVYYLIGLAWVRILLVMVPLLFHSYTGTALRCQTAYQLLYWGTLIVVLVHLLSLGLINPESLEALIPLDAASSTDDADRVHEWRRIWYILLLSLVSDICHLILLLHVRSTAPAHHPLLTGPNKPPSIYFTLRSQQQQGGGNIPWGDNGLHRSTRLGSNNHNNNNNGSNGHGEPALMHAMSGTLLLLDFSKRPFVSCKD